MAAASDIVVPLAGMDEARTPRIGSLLIKPIEVVSAFLLALIIVLLLTGVASRYVFSIPIVWVDEVASISFL